MSHAILPFLSAYDPPGTSEGTLDPLGLYQIADQLATRLVPAVRERMQRVRFLTAIAIGSLVTEGIESDPQQPDLPPFMIWEWLVVEAIMRTLEDDAELWAVPGTLVTQRALAQHGYLDDRCYLKTSRIFGFHGVYKRLATHARLVDVHLSPLAEGEKLVDAWARDCGLGGLDGFKTLRDKWRAAVERCLDQTPPRTKPGWGEAEWSELANAVAPHLAKSREKRFLRELLHASEERALGALPQIWQLQEGFGSDDYSEAILHNRLERKAPTFGTLLKAIRAYESFCRSLQDGFDVLRAEAETRDALGFAVTSIGSDDEFAESARGLEQRYEAARLQLGEIDLQFQNLFDERFALFAEPMSAADCAIALCEHHEMVQKAKSADGKRPWFDRLGQERIFIRHQYREGRRAVMPGQYVHDYRGNPIRRFYLDLT